MNPEINFPTERLVSKEYFLNKAPSEWLGPGRACTVLPQRKPLPHRSAARSPLGSAGVPLATEGCRVKEWQGGGDRYRESQVTGTGERSWGTALPGCVGKWHSESTLGPRGPRGSKEIRQQVRRGSQGVLLTPHFSLSSSA